MPASDFTWGTTQSLPIFQVYGTKRKAPDDLTDASWTQPTQNATADDRQVRIQKEIILHKHKVFNEILNFLTVVIL